MDNPVFTSPCASPNLSPSEQRKRQRQAQQDDHSDDMDYQSLAEFYKGKLISLARAHASLLAAVSTQVKIVKPHPKPSDDNDDGSATLLCSSQLSTDDELVVDEQPQKGENQNNEEEDAKLTRWGSLASQKSTFSNLINGCHELERISELEGWLKETVAKEELASSGEKDLQNDDDEQIREGILPRHLTEIGTVEPCKADSENRIVPHDHKMKPKVVRVGVGVLVRDPRNKRKVFAGIRKGSHGAGLLALPGGHLEINESWQTCASREVEEETGLHITNIQFAHVTNDPMPEEEKHYITIFMMADCFDPTAQPKNLEPHKCEGWESFSWEDFNDIINGKREDLRLFGPLKHLVEEKPVRVLELLAG